ncbi:MAG: AMP-binding protein [Halieaceae bacterium]|jgi:fatty-acyl-CoA synthase|nr:AMP-binding protein [Halieaceae bacterium]
MDTIAELIRSRANDSQTALLYDDQQWSYREFVSACSARAAYLLDKRSEDRPFHVGVLLDNIPEFPMWLGAGALVGATVVGINPTRKGEDLARDIRYTECQFLITEEKYLQDIAGLEFGIPSGQSHNVDSDTYREVIAAYDGSAPPEVDVSPEDTFCLIFTSGTSGNPKACICSQGRILFSAQMTCQMRELDASDIHYIAMPLFHSNSITLGFMPPLVHGGAMALRRKFSASRFIDDIRHYGATFFNYVGKPLAYILATAERDDDTENPLRKAMGNEAADVDIANFSQRFGCSVTDAYGTTEGGAVVLRTADMPKGALGMAMLESTKVMNSETSTECPRARFDSNGEILNANEAIGELVDTEAASAFEGYWRNDEANKKRTREGYIWMGDLVYRDEQGFFYFVGRDSDWMRVDGENIAGAQIEQVLHRFPSIMLAAVYPVPDPVVGDKVMAAIQLKDGEEFDADAFLQFLQRQSDFGSKWMPSFIRVSDALPMTQTKKIIKRQLRCEHWNCEDPIWWRQDRNAQFQLLMPENVKAIEQTFSDRGRSNALKLA